MVKALLNKAYFEYTAGNGERHEFVPNFSRYVKQEYGLRLSFEPTVDNMGRSGFKLLDAEVVHPSKYAMFLIKWS